MVGNLSIFTRIRVLEHDLEVNLLLAVRAGLLLANNAPSTDAKLMEAGTHTVKAQHTFIVKMHPAVYQQSGTLPG